MSHDLNQGSLEQEDTLRPLRTNLIKKDTLSVDRQKMWTYTLPDAWLQKRGFRYLLNIVYYVQVESMRRVVQKWVLFFT